MYTDDGETVLDEFFPESAADLAARLPWEKHHGSRPVAEDYMPDFDVPEGDLGWCLYETVSEGTPVTPVFGTAEALIDRLATVGQDHDRQPMRRAAAEALVRAGHSFGSFLIVGGQMLRGDADADVIEGLSGRGESL